jgi:hypothetical protein
MVTTNYTQTAHISIGYSLGAISKYVEFKVLTAVVIKTSVFCEINLLHCIIFQKIQLFNFKAISSFLNFCDLKCVPYTNCIKEMYDKSVPPSVALPNYKTDFDKI